MTLTAENMKSSDNMLNYATFVDDVARMDKSQLNDYLRRTFTNNPNTELPHTFWSYWFNMRKHGPSYDGHDAPGPATFFSNLHDIIGYSAVGTYRILDRTGEVKPDFSFRSRFRNVIGNILEESTNIITPSDEQKELASSAVEAIGAFKSAESFNRSVEHIVTNRVLNEVKPILITYPEDLRTDLDKLRIEHPKMIEKAQNLIESGRFGELKLSY